MMSNDASGALPVTRNKRTAKVTTRQPIADKLIEDGVISGYGLSTEELHGDHGFTHRSYFAIPGLASIDAIQAAFAAAGGPGIQAWTEAVFEPDGHSDVLFMVLHAGGQGGEE